MKKFIYLPFLILSLVIISTSCEKDEPEPENEFVLDGTNYCLPNGFLDDFGFIGNGSSHIAIRLTSRNISYNNGYTGTGDFIFFDLISSSASGLAAGTYNYSSFADPFSFISGTLLVKDYNFSTQIGEIFPVAGGTVKIEIDESVYTFTFNLILTNSKTVTGYYNGTLTTV